MPQRSTDFQELVHLIERHRDPNSIVTESKILFDRITGVGREVDVVIEVKNDGYSVIVCVEVNEKTRPADIQWVEQQYQKHQTLPTNKLVLVSKNGFTGTAREKANSLGVVTTGIDDIQDHFFGYESSELTNIRINFTIPFIYLIVDGERIFATNSIIKARISDKEFDLAGTVIHYLMSAIDMRKCHESFEKNQRMDFKMSVPTGGHAIVFKYKSKNYTINGSVEVEGYVQKVSRKIICKIGKYHTDHVIFASGANDVDSDKIIAVLPNDGKPGFIRYNDIEMRLGVSDTA